MWILASGEGDFIVSKMMILSKNDGAKVPVIKSGLPSSFHFYLHHEVWKYSKNVTVMLLYLRNKLWLTLPFVDGRQIILWKMYFYIFV